MALFGKTKEKTVDIADFLKRKNDQMVDRMNNRANDMEKDTMVWLCYAFAAIAFVIGVAYLGIFVARLMGK